MRTHESEQTEQTEEVLVMGSLSGRRALVTGASSGMGRAIAQRFAREGASVAVGGRDAGRVQATCESIAESGGTAVPVIGDVSVADDAQRVVDSASDGLGGLDIVVNNAGIDASDWMPLHEWDIAVFDDILATNLRGPFLVSKFAVPHLLEAGGGAFLHISSVCAITVWSGDCAYDISKAGVNMLSDHLAVEYASQGITSNTLMPGLIATEMYEMLKESMPEFEREVVGRHPIGRAGSVDEIAEAAVLLCSGRANFLTGANISIDGAYSRV
jgi:NAD(P)-dependent dehydrogenase (short-subunit alcohol dehydrogenase family)